MSDAKWSVKRIMDLDRSIGILTDREYLKKLMSPEMGVTDPDVIELLNLGMAAVEARDALKTRLDRHQAAYEATLPLRMFQTYERVIAGDGTEEPSVNHGVFEARTAKHAVKLAHEAGDTNVTDAIPLAEIK